MTHYYLYVACGTEGCPAHLLIMHFEAPETPYFEINYSDQAFYLQLGCEVCGQTRTYLPQDVKSKSSLEPIHPEGWLPLLPFPPPNVRGTH